MKKENPQQPQRNDDDDDSLSLSSLEKHSAYKQADKDGYKKKKKGKKKNFCVSAFEKVASGSESR